MDNAEIKELVREYGLEDYRAERAANKMSDCAYEIITHLLNENDALIHDIHKYADANTDLLAQIPEWVSVEIEKPEGKRLVLLEDGSIHAAEYSKNIVIIGGHFDFDMPKATHSMPLPPTDTGGD